MKRWRGGLAGLLGLLLVGGGVTYYAQLQAGGVGSVGPGRYRDGRGRFGRGGVIESIQSFFSPDTSVALNFAPVDNTGFAYPSTAPSTLQCPRASVAEVISQDGQTITQVAANVCRVMTGAVDDAQLGVAVEQTTRTNMIDDARDLSVASWTKVNTTCAHTASGMRGGDTNGASTCTATGANGTVWAVTGEALGAYQCFSAFVKRRTGSGTIKPTMDGVTFLADISAQLSTTVWKRLVPGETLGCMAVKGGTSRCIVVPGVMDAPLVPKVGFQIGTSGDAIDIDFTQNERCTDFRASTPNESIGGNATRAAETPDIAISVALPTAYCVAATFVTTGPSNTGAVGWTPSANRRLHGVPGDGDAGIITASGSFDDSYDDLTTSFTTNTTTLAAPASVATGIITDGGVRMRVVTFWNGGNLNACLDGYCANGLNNPPEGSPDSLPYTAPAWTRYRLGGLDLGAASGKLDGVLKQIQLDPHSQNCQRFLDITASNFYASCGDSISCCPTAGIPGYCDYANQLLAQTNRVQLSSFAKGGAYTGPNGGTGDNNMLYQWTNFVRGKNFGGLIVLGGVNDIKSGKDMSTALANLTQIWTEARADHLRLVTATLTPCGANAGWNATRETQRQTLNTAIRADAAANSATTTLVDLAVLPGLRCTNIDAGPDVLCLDGGAGSCDSNDGLHPSALCETTLIGSAFAAAVHP